MKKGKGKIRYHDHLKEEGPEFVREVQEEYSRAVIAARLVAIRKAAKLSQEKLARRLKTQKSAISRLESGRVGYTVTKICAFARACGRDFVFDFPPHQKKPAELVCSWTRPTKRVAKKKVAKKSVAK